MRRIAGVTAAVLTCFGALATSASGQLGVVTEYAIPGTPDLPSAIAPGTDSALWFTEQSGNQIGRIPITATPSTPGITEFSSTIPEAPNDIAAGPDGALWYTQSGTDEIGRITTAGAMSECSLGSVGVGRITSGPENSLWVTGTTSDVIVQVPATPPPAGGACTGIDSDPAALGTDPLGITSLGSDLWMTFQGSNAIARFDSTTDALTPFTAGLLPGANPVEITAGPDGNLWFTDDGAEAIGRITPAGVITEFLLPAGNTEPSDITTGPDGQLWFTLRGSNEIGRVDTTGAYTGDFAIPTAASDPRGIALGPDNDIWFTEFFVDQIGELDTATPAPGGGSPGGTPTPGPPGPAGTVDIAIAKQASPDPAVAGQSLTYTLTIANFGPSVATNVSVIDFLPGGVQFVSAVPSQGTCGTGPNVGCSLGNMNVGGVATVTIVVTPSVAGTLANSAAAFAASPNESFSSNNAASVVTTVNSAAAPVIALSGPRRCELLADRFCFIDVESNEDSTATATGTLIVPRVSTAQASLRFRFRRVSKTVAAEEQEELRLRVSGRARRAVRRALSRRRGARARIRVSVRDADGNATTRIRRIRIVG